MCVLGYKDFDWDYGTGIMGLWDYGIFFAQKVFFARRLPQSNFSLRSLRSLREKKISTRIGVGNFNTYNT